MIMNGDNVENELFTSELDPCCLLVKVSTCGDLGELC